jgi:hypothetical protein
VKLATLLHDLELNLLAHQTILHAIHPDLPSLLRAVEEAKQSPELQQVLEAKYDAPLKKFLETADPLGVWE